jgi:2-dehydro-3-deoxyphosphogluconate aldolase/(4S)-4-hydroxy-2-oxoglutarate aldolase
MTAFDVIEDHGLVPVLTVERATDIGPLAEALLTAHLPCAEITFRTAAASEAIEFVATNHPQMLVGAGTVLTVDQARTAAAAGARFIATPGFDEVVVDWCLEHGVPVAPGVMTPTEAGIGMRKGLGNLKFFPAETAGGVTALTALAAVYPGLRFIPTGGIEAGNLARYLALPNVIACGGSWLATRKLIARGDFAEIERLTAEAVDIVRRARSEKR